MDFANFFALFSHSSLFLSLALFISLILPWHFTRNSGARGCGGALVKPRCVCYNKPIKYLAALGRKTPCKAIAINTGSNATAGPRSTSTPCAIISPMCTARPGGRCAPSSRRTPTATGPWLSPARCTGPGWPGSRSAAWAKRATCAATASRCRSWSSATQTRLLRRGWPTRASRRRCSRRNTPAPFRPRRWRPGCRCPATSRWTPAWAASVLRCAATSARPWPRCANVTSCPG